MSNSNLNTTPGRQENMFDESSKRKKKRREKTGLSLGFTAPKTTNQRLTFQAYEKGLNLILHGYAGTGKTYISLYLALREILQEGSTKQKLVIVRSAVPSRDIGFLPGNSKEKMKIYELPYQQIVNSLFKRGDAYEILKNKGVVDFMSTSFIRGITIDNSVVVVDEYQNLDFGELDSIITRIGDDARIIFCGDEDQGDLQRIRQKSGLDDFMDIITDIESFETIEFDEDDIVRSGLVREYLIAKSRYYK